MNKVRWILSLALLFALGAKGQESSSVFNFLKIPLSSHIAALGGENVSLTQDDPSLIFSNPAIAAAVNDNSLNLDYLTYLHDTQVMGAAYVKVFSVRHTVGITGRLFNYGSMDQTDEAGNVIGSFSAKDIALSGLYSYTMGNGWVGGAACRFIYSKYAEYSSFSIGFDVGLHYNNEAKNFSFGLVAKNIGAQLSSFYEGQTEHLPFDLQAGITQGIAHAPFRISVTLRDLTRWSKRYYYNPEGKDSFGRKIFNHVVFGVDFLPTDNTYIALGYNCRRANELKAAGSSHGAGLSFGGGFQARRLKVGVSYAKYHVSVSSLTFNVSYSL